MNRRPKAARARAATLMLMACGTLAAEVPPAPSEPVSTVMHGVTVNDPYRNLERLDLPATRAWLDAQGAHAAAQLARIEGRDAIAERIRELSRASGDAVRSIVRLPGRRLLFLRRKAGENQFKLVIRDGVRGAERVLVDPDALAAASGMPHAVNYFSPSWDGRSLAYGVSASGSEDASLHLMDIASGKALRDPIPRVRQDAPTWSPDSRYLAFNQLRELPPGSADTETYLDTTVYLLDRQRPRAAPRALFGPLVNPELGLRRLDVGEIVFAPDSRWMVARTTDTTVPEGHLFVAPVQALRGGAPRWRRIAGPDDKITRLQLRGSRLLVRSYADAPRGRVLALSLPGARKDRARVVVPEPARGVLEDFRAAGRVVDAEIHEGFNTRVRRFGPGHGAEGADLVPERAGSTYLVGDLDPNRPAAWLATSDWTETSRIVALTPGGAARDTGLRNNPLPAGTPPLEVHEVRVPSHDGVPVPLAILHRRGLARDGRNPTLLVGYGAYGFSFSAYFDPQRVAWLERGGVLAYANVRGSGAFGDAWHRAGFKATKPNTWKDGIAAARHLVDQGYTSPSLLGVWGTSAGGIFAGRAMTEAPELFAAAILDVGVLDAVRFEESANGITNVSEFGSVRNADEFPALLAMSTYHHVKPGTAYPAVLLVHGLNDPRVDFWHSAKTAAALQAATRSARPVLLRLDAQAGHGVGSTAAQDHSERADIYAFLLWQFGRLSAAP